MEAVCGGALSDIGDARGYETWNLENGSLLGMRGVAKESENGEEQGQTR